VKRPRPSLCAALALAACVAACEEVEPEPGTGGPVVPAGARCDPVRDGTLATAEVTLLAEINRLRAEGGRCGLLTFLPAAPLRFDPALRCAARLHVVDMITRMYLGAVDPDGRGTGPRLGEVEYAASSFAEADGFARADGDDPTYEASAAADIAATWADNPSTCWQLRARELTAIGIGAAPGNYAFKDMDPAFGVYFSAIFAAP
jgi:uncharacterized protein YkwD